MSEIIVYTDGSCLGNPGPGGWAFIVLVNKQIIKKSAGPAYYTTNNRMEMSALLEALLYLQENFSNQKIALFSDSNLLIQTLNQGWKRKANQDIWQKIELARHNLNISFAWVKAHHTDRYNNLCDQMAQKMAFKAQKEVNENPQLSIKLSQEQKKSVQELSSENSGQISLL